MKKGFSLVEIMVVVVIMGVLAAVGVPKLFGVIAKARAVEVPVAAGTYVNLQNAFLNEFNGVGSWKDIGYGAPGGSDGKTEYFEYTGCINGTIPFDNMEPDMPGWQASNRSKLNYCGAGSAWAVVIDPAGERKIEYRRLISSADCEALTVNWGSVGSTVEGMCEATGELHVAEKDDDKPDTPQEPEAGSSASEDPSSNPGESTSSNNSNSEQQQQGDCDALAASIKNDNGNKYGWICVSECGMFAPPGKARNAGFDTGTLQKKKNTGGTCEKTTSDTGSGNSGNQGGNNSSASGTGSSSTSVANGGGQQQGDGESVGENEETGSGQGSHGGGNGSQSGGNSGGNGSGSMGTQYPGYNGNGEPHAFNKDTDYCDGTVQNGVCEGSYRSNDECVTWAKKKCNNNGNGNEKNQENCGACNEWQTPN